MLIPPSAVSPPCFVRPLGPLFLLVLPSLDATPPPCRRPPPLRCRSCPFLWLLKISLCAAWLGSRWTCDQPSPAANNEIFKSQTKGQERQRRGGGQRQGGGVASRERGTRRNRGPRGWTRQRDETAEGATNQHHRQTRSTTTNKGAEMTPTLLPANAE